MTDNPYAPPPPPPSNPDPRFGTPPASPDPRFGTPPVSPDPRFGTPASYQPPTPYQPTAGYAQPAYGPPPGQPAYGPPPGQPAYGPPPGYGPAPGYAAVPGYGAAPAYGAAPGYGAPATPIRGNEGLGVALLILGGGLVLASLLAAFAAPSAARAYHNGYALGYESSSPVVVYGFTQLLGGAVAVALWIVGSIWLQRGLANAQAVAGAVRLRRSTVWAWLGWIVPVVALWFPKQILDDVEGFTIDPADPSIAKRHKLSNLAWGLWLAYGVTFGLAHSWYSSGVVTTPDGTVMPAQYHSAVHPGLSFLSAVIGIAAFAAWVPVVRAISRDQERLAARFTGPTYLR